MLGKLPSDGAIFKSVIARSVSDEAIHEEVNLMMTPHASKHSHTDCCIANAPRNDGGNSIFLSYRGKLPAIDIKILLCCLAMAACYLGLYFGSNIETLTPYNSGGYSNNFLAPGFINIRHLGQYQLWLLVLIFAALLIIPKKSYYLLPLAIMGIIWWWLLLQGQSRGVLLSLLLASLGGVMLFKRQIAPLLIVMVVGLILAIVVDLYTVDHTNISDLWQRMERTGNADEVRYLTWQDTAYYIPVYPLLGIGPMNISSTYSPLAESLLGGIHNIALKVVVVYGIPAGLVLLAIVYYGFTAWIARICQQAKGALHQLGMALTLTFLTMACYALLSQVVETPLSQQLGAVIIGWMMGIYFSLGAACNSPSPSPLSLGERGVRYSLHLSYIAFAMIILCGYLAIALPQLYYRNELTKMYFNDLYRKHHFLPVQLQPNFWAQVTFAVRGKQETGVARYTKY